MAAASFITCAWIAIKNELLLMIWARKTGCSMVKKTLIPSNVREEFIKLLQAGRGSESKRQAARKLVFSRLVGRMGMNWWNLNCEGLKNEMTGIEETVWLIKN